MTNSQHVGINMKPPVFRSDIPNEDWLAEKVEDSLAGGRNLHGVLKYFGPITGSFDRDLNLPISELTLLQGERSEQSNVRPDSLIFIKENFSEVSKEPLYVEIDPLGVPWVSEGNHRIMVAAELGVQSLPVKVRYFSGSERIDGPFSPEKLIAHDLSFQKNAFSLFSEIVDLGTKYVVNPEKDSVVITRLKDGATLFMQGDDASKFLDEVDAIEDVELRNYAISQYDDVFDLPEPKQAAGEPVRLSDDKLRGVLAAEGEGMNEENVGFYPSVDALVKKVRSSKNWEQGSIFVFAESEDKFVVMKQIAPASCEMLTITQHGYKDVITGYAVEHDALVAMVKDYMAGDLSLEEKSLEEAFEVGMQKGSCSVVDTTLDKTHSGKVLGVTDHHVVLSLGRSALVVGKADIDRVPAVGEDVDLKFSGGKGVFAPVKAVGVER